MPKKEVKTLKKSVFAQIKDIFRRGLYPGGHPSEAEIVRILTGASLTGHTVDEEKAMRFSAVYSCVRVLSESVAQLPLKIYRRKGDGRQEAADHYLYPLLHGAPNPRQTAFSFWEAVTASLALWGNAYALIDLDNAGRVAALWFLDPSTVTPRKVLTTGELVYDVAMRGGTSRTFLWGELFHIPGLGFDGLRGHSVVRVAAEAIGQGIAASEYAGRFFDNDATPRGVLETDAFFKDPSAVERLRKSWNDLYQGTDNAHRVAILENGLKFKPLTINPEDAQLLETRKFNRSEIAGIFRVPLHMIGDLDKATFCLPAGTEVLTTNGPKEVESVSDQDVVWSRDNGIWVKSKVVKTAMSGIDPIYEIKTTNRTIRCNGRHRILRRCKVDDPKGGRGGYQNITWVDRYVPAENLSIGDTLVVMDGGFEGGESRTPTREATVGFMEFCGLLLGDGTVTSGYVSIARGENARYMDYYREVIKREFVKYDGGNGRGNKENTPLTSIAITEQDRQTRFSSVLACKELSELGLSGDAHTKTVPAWVYGVNETLRLALIRGFAESDGHVDKKGRLSMSSCNRKLLSGIRHLCMMSGIPVTNLRLQEGTTRLPTGNETHFSQWSFTCSNPEANLKIGSHDPEDLARMQNGKPFNKKGRAYPRFGGKGDPLNGASLSRIVSISITKPEPVYDIEVENTHNFVADGVIVHNSNIEHQSIDFVKFSLSPWLKRIEQAISLQLFSPGERKRYFAEFKTDAMLKGDTKSRYEAYEVAIRSGWMSINEVRGLENLNPVEGGDEHYLQMQMVPISMAGKEVEDGQGNSSDPGGIPDPAEGE